jgi:hypothetical protein
LGGGTLLPSGLVIADGGIDGLPSGRGAPLARGGAALTDPLALGFGGTEIDAEPDALGLGIDVDPDALPLAVGFGGGTVGGLARGGGFAGGVSLR